MKTFDVTTTNGVYFRVKASSFTIDLDGQLIFFKEDGSMKAGFSAQYWVSVVEDTVVE